MGVNPGMQACSYVSCRMTVGEINAREANTLIDRQSIYPVNGEEKVFSESCVFLQKDQESCFQNG